MFGTRSVGACALGLMCGIAAMVGNLGCGCMPKVNGERKGPTLCSEFRVVDKPDRLPWHEANKADLARRTDDPERQAIASFILDSIEGEGDDFELVAVYASPHDATLEHFVFTRVRWFDAGVTVFVYNTMTMQVVWAYVVRSR